MKQLLNFSSIATGYGDGKANYPFRYAAGRLQEEGVR